MDRLLIPGRSDSKGRNFASPNEEHLLSVTNYSFEWDLCSFGQHGDAIVNEVVNCMESSSKQEQEHTSQGSNFRIPPRPESLPESYPVSS